MTVVESFLVSARSSGVVLAFLIIGLAIVVGVIAWSVLGDTLGPVHLAPTRWLSARIG
jgi:hypothetical protein